MASSAPQGAAQGARQPGYFSQRKLQGAKTREFDLIQKFERGYRSREDITTLPPDVLVKNSQNVLTNTFQRVGIRQGYVLDGQRDSTPSSSAASIVTSFDWQRHTGDTRHLRSGFLTAAGVGKLQFRYVATAGDNWDANTFTEGQVFWIDLVTSLTSVSFNYADWWDTTEVKSELLFVNGLPQIWEWTGGITTLQSSSFASGVIQGFNTPGSIATLNPTPTGGGGGYHLGDILTLAAGGRNATATVALVSGGGVVTTVALAFAGGGYSIASGIGTISNQGGSACSLEITAINGSGGSGYLVGDVLTVSSGTGATFKVVSIGLSGEVSEIELLTPGTGYTTGTKATTGGTGSGCTLKITSVVQGYIQKTGTKSWGEEGFYSAKGGRTVNINGNQYTYTGGESSTYITGISADPTAEPVQSVIFQQPVISQNSGIKGLPIDVGNDLISVLKGQLYIGNLNNRVVYISKVNTYYDFTFSTPRLVSDGALITLDGTPTSFTPEQSEMYIAAGKDMWFQTQFKLSADNQNESLSIQRLKTTNLQAARSQALTTKIKNLIAFVSFENFINSFGTEQNYLLDPQMNELSYSIINDVLQYDFTGGQVFYFSGSASFPGQHILVSIPRQSLVIIYNMTDPKNLYWEAPQILPISCFSVIDGDIYGHSSQASNSFKLFTGWNDDSHSVKAVAAMAFFNMAQRTVRKSDFSTFVEGYITSNTKLTLGLQRELNGSVAQFPIYGSDMAIVEPVPDDASLGIQSLGKNSLGGASVILPANATPPKFRIYKTYPRSEYFEEQISFTSEGIDQQWELIAFGPNASPASRIPTELTE